MQRALTSYLELRISCGIEAFVMMWTRFCTHGQALLACLANGHALRASVRALPVPAVLTDETGSTEQHPDAGKRSNMLPLMYTSPQASLSLAKNDIANLMTCLS
jgi:hypothetical protein